MGTIERHLTAHDLGIEAMARVMSPHTHVIAEDRIRAEELFSEYRRAVLAQVGPVDGPAPAEQRVEFLELELVRARQERSLLASQLEASRQAMTSLQGRIADLLR